LQAILRITGARSLQATLVAVVVGIVSFVMMQALPGDSAYRIAAGRYGYDVLDAQAVELVRQELGLERPLYLQLLQWMQQLASFNLGNSLVSGNPVWEEIATQLGASLKLAITAVSLSLMIAIPVGFVSGLRVGGAVDRLALGFSVVLRSIPAFAIGVILILLLAVQFRMFPVAGYGELKNYALPSLTLALSLAAVSNRGIRDAVASSINSQWYEFSLTKGLSRATTLRRHVARNVAAPTLAYVGVQLAFLIEGVVIIESVFSWPGIGHALVHAIFERNVPMVQGTALTLGLIFVGMSFLIDVVCQLIDPRDSALPA